MRRSFVSFVKQHPARKGESQLPGTSTGRRYPRSTSSKFTTPLDAVAPACTSKVVGHFATVPRSEELPHPSIDTLADGTHRSVHQ